MDTPNYLKKYFWDVDFKDLNEKDLNFIAERIIEYGDEKSAKWLLDNFGREQIKRVLLKGRNFSKKSANYWSLILDIPRNKILCLNKLYRKAQKKHWPY